MKLNPLAKSSIVFLLLLNKIGPLPVSPLYLTVLYEPIEGLFVCLSSYSAFFLFSLLIYYNLTKEQQQTAKKALKNIVEARIISALGVDEQTDIS